MLSLVKESRNAAASDVNKGHLVWSEQQERSENVQRMILTFQDSPQHYVRLTQSFFI